MSREVFSDSARPRLCLLTVSGRDCGRAGSVFGTRLRVEVLTTDYQTTRYSISRKMATTATPKQRSGHPRQRTSSHSRTRSGNIPSRPTTPLRPPSRTSLRASQTTPSGNASLSGSDFPLASLEPAFAELSDSMADLEANFMHLQLLNESLGRFNENFGAFLYGMNMSAFCVDFPEVSLARSTTRCEYS